MLKKYLRVALGCFFGLSFFLGATCRPLPDDKSAFAAASGELTAVLGSSCRGRLSKGFDTCYVERGRPLPVLYLTFTNPAEYAVGDCELNIFKQGAVNEAGVVQIDLNPLTPQAEKNGFCFLKVEIFEKYPDNDDENQMHTIPLKGGFFIELLDKGYNPNPTLQEIGFCQEVKIARTVKGRTVIESKSCK